jgi:phospholipase/carboxylesterase
VSTPEAKRHPHRAHRKPALAVLASASLLVGAPSHAGHAHLSHLAAVVRGGEGPPTLVLLHGYAAKATDWVPFATTIVLPAGGRYVFPQAPEPTRPPDGPIGGRAWWRLDLESHVRAGSQLPDLATFHPLGIDAAAASVRALVRERASSGSLFLGGFSQGAMVASQIAFTTDDAITALVLLSGTPVDVATWRRGFARRRGLPVFMSHGRADRILPFAADERFARELAAAGLKVTWVPFEGGHDVPAPVVAALNAFLAPLLRINDEKTRPVGHADEREEPAPSSRSRHRS